MTTSQTTSLCEPRGTDRVPVGTLGYFRARNRHRIYSLVLDEFQRSGLSQADLARRLGKKPELVCRLLASPANWRLDTTSDYLFAISGAEAAYEIGRPLTQAPRNDIQPHWIAGDNWEISHDDAPPSKTTSSTSIDFQAVA